MAKKPATKKATPKMRSGFEKKIKEDLERRGVPYKYEQTTIPYTIPESKHRYVPDFELPNCGIFVEGKGKFDAAARKKMTLVIEQNPDKDIRMLFMRNNKITKTSKVSYTDWCEKRGIKCHVSATGEVPEEWLQENKKNKENTHKTAKRRNRTR